MDFETFLSWLSSNGFSIAATILSVIFGLVIMIIQIKKYKFNSNQAKEDNLKYRLEDYMSKKGFVRTGQTFDGHANDYELDPRTGSLVVVGVQDLQELVQSSADCALDKVLEKYGVLPDMLVSNGSAGYNAAVNRSGFDFDMSDMRDDLEYLMDEDVVLDGMRERYGMPGASSSELFDFVSAQLAANSTRLDVLKNVQNKEVSDENSKKED